MEKRDFDFRRTIRRMAPKHAAPVGVFKDSHQLAFGGVADISMTGACIAVASPLAPGSDVDLALSFYQQTRLYEIAARVVWNRRGGAGDEGFEDMHLHGVQFTRPSALEKSRLHALLASEDFVDVFRPCETEFDFLLYEFVGKLDELITEMQNTTGREIENLLIDIGRNDRQCNVRGPQEPRDAHGGQPAQDYVMTAGGSTPRDRELLRFPGVDRRG